MERSDEKKKSTCRLIPEGELPCIWMEAGLVAYKLCNQDFDCEHCSFDAEMRWGGQGEKPQASAGPPQPDTLREADTTDVMKGYLYHPGHTWVKIMESGDHGPSRVRIGLDGFAAKILPRVKSVVLPRQSQVIRQGHVFCWAVCGSSTMPLVAPMSGTVVGVNLKVRARPQMISAEPYGESWFVAVEALDAEGELAELREGADAVSWMASEWRKFERLASLLHWPTQAQMEGRGEVEVGATMADGGERLIDVSDEDILNRYFKFIAPFFDKAPKPL